MPLSSAIIVKKTYFETVLPKENGIAAMLLQGQGLNIMTKLC